MSSGAEGGAGIALAVMAPVALTFAAGWMLFQGGKLVVSVIEANERFVEEKKADLAAGEQRRKDMAVAGRKKIVDSCRSILSEIEDDDDISVENLLEIDIIRSDLEHICSETVRDNADDIERSNARAMALLDQIAGRLKRIQEIIICDSGEYDGYAVSDLLDDMRLTIAACNIRSTVGENVVVTDYHEIERKELLEQLRRLVSRIEIALQFRAELAGDPGLYELYEENCSFFNSCFSNVDKKIQRLYSADISNKELKKGLDDLERMMERYNRLYPAIDRKKNRLANLARYYRVYRYTAVALGETPRKLGSFTDTNEINRELVWLQKRAERAAECAKIYEQLGSSGYICYAWTTELQAMGYNVRGRNAISELAGYTPQRIGKLPVYKWDEEAITEFFGLTDDCSLQLIVHEDGTTTMQTIAQTDNSDRIVPVQEKHCANLAAVRKRLRDNWFIFYDEIEETESAQTVMSAAEWQADEANAWHAAVPQKKHKSKKERKKQKATQARMEKV